MAYPPTMQAGYYAQPAPAPAPSRTNQLLMVLRDSIFPSEREMAVQQLTSIDWRGEPGLVPALVSAAKSDPAPAVRAGCVHALVAMKVNSAPVLEAVQALQTDKDPRVHQEVIQAMAAFPK
jgi:hypothetical protein